MLLLTMFTSGLRYSMLTPLKHLKNQEMYLVQKWLTKLESMYTPQVIRLILVKPLNCLEEETQR